MLTKGDLNLIGKLLDSRLESKFSEKLSPIQKQLSKIDKKLDKTIDFFDKREINITKNVRSLQNHLGLSVMDFA